MSRHPGDTDPLSVSGLGAVVVINRHRRTFAAANITRFIFPQRETQWGFIHRAVFNKQGFTSEGFTDLTADN